MAVPLQKKQVVDKKVTDYFTRRLSGSQPPSPGASQLAPPPRVPRANNASVSRPIPRATKREDGVATLTDPRPADSSTTMTTRSVAKRVRSPETILDASHIPVLRKPSNKRARVEEAPHEPTRLPFAFPEEHTSQTPVSSPASSEQLIHTSQSDEMDLTLSTPSGRDSDQVRKDIERWKKGAVAPATSPKSRELVREDTPLSPLTSLATSPARPTSLVDVNHRYSEDFTRNTYPPDTPIQSPICPFSASDTREPSSSPLPPTPKALDPDAKAANLIAEIRARAFASVALPSDDEKPLEYRDLDDSDEDDFSFSPICIGNRTRDKQNVAAPLLTRPPPSLERPSSNIRRSVAAKAYSDNVPSKLSEAEFWKRYFQSKLFNAHRASIRSSATQHVVKDDPIFDKYLEKDDDGMEPKRPREAVADLYVSLGATLEDHAETGNEKDITMRAGRQRGVLPLIRKFNDHSERLLNSTLGDNPPFKRRRAEGDGQDSFSLIELEDLHDPESSTGIFLEMQDRQRYFEGQLTRGVAAEQAPVQPVDVSVAYADFRRELEGWDVRFNQLRLERKAADAALLSMTQNVTARLDTKTKKNGLPVALFRQVTTCQTAANEFLRQFWGATCPPPIDTPFAPSPAQRSAKAAKMASYLAGTREKVDALVRAAQAEGVDGTGVEVAMKPVLDAVEHALAFYRAKNPSRAIQHKVA